MNFSQDQKGDQTSPDQSGTGIGVKVGSVDLALSKSTDFARRKVEHQQREKKSQKDRNVERHGWQIVSHGETMLFQETPLAAESGLATPDQSPRIEPPSQRLEGKLQKTPWSK